MLKRITWAGTAIILAACVVSGCGGKKVMVPPRVDLQDFPVIALVQFSTNAEGNLGEFASQKFIEMAQGAQPGVRFLELEDQESVLADVQQDDLGPRAVRAICEEYGTGAIIFGTVEVTDVKPSVDLSAMLTSGTVRADVEASLSVRLLEGATGATVWTRSCKRRESVAHLGLNSAGGVSFSASDPEAAYGKLVGGLIHAVTDDFRVQYVRQ